jgi:hypothetical protein
MAIRSGLANQVGFVKEVTYGTGVTVTKFLPVKKADFKLDKGIAQGTGLFSGDFLDRSTQRAKTTRSGTLSMELDVQNKDMGLLIQALMGTTVTPVIQGAGPGYLQTHTLADPFGKSLTIQTGVPELTGTVRPYTFVGCKVLGAEFTMQPDELFTCSLDIDARDVTEATGLASASYATALTPFSIGQGGGATPANGLTVKTGTFGGETTLDGVRQATVNIKRLSKDDRFNLGNAGLKSEPVLNDKTEAITGTLSMEYLDKTKIADLFAADTATSIVIEALGANTNASFYYTFRITLPACYFNGDTPIVDGPDVVTGDFPFVCLYDGTNLPKIEIIEVATTL